MWWPGELNYNFYQKNIIVITLCNFSFCFLLWGLSAVASSINLLVLKFMTISLEEEEQGEDELHEMGANIITLDEEVSLSFIIVFLVYLLTLF